MMSPEFFYNFLKYDKIMGNTQQLKIKTENMMQQ